MLPPMLANMYILLDDFSELGRQAISITDFGYVITAMWLRNAILCVPLTEDGFFLVEELLLTSYFIWCSLLSLISSEWLLIDLLLTSYWPLIDLLLTSYWPLIDFLFPSYSLLIVTSYSPLIDLLLTSYSPITDLLFTKHMYVTENSQKVAALEMEHDMSAHNCSLHVSP